MIADLRKLHSPDVSDLPSWVPDSEEFAILIQVIAGPEGAPGEESFGVTLCSPAWVERQARREGIISGRHLLIVSDYDYERVRNYIVKYLRACSGSTWQEVAEKVARFGYWEFEDYQS